MTPHTQVKFASFVSLPHYFNFPSTAETGLTTSGHVIFNIINLYLLSILADLNNWDKM